MSVVDSLPDRPLTDAELATLNRADAVSLAVDVTEAEGTTGEIRGLLVGADDWLKGLVYADGWRVVASEAGGESGRFDAMRTCEDAVRAALGE